MYKKYILGRIQGGGNSATVPPPLAAPEQNVVVLFLISYWKDKACKPKNTRVYDRTHVIYFPLFKIMFFPVGVLLGLFLFLKSLFLFCFHIMVIYLVLRYMFYSRSSLRRNFCSYLLMVCFYFVIILMGVHLFCRHLFYYRNLYVSFVPIYEWFFLFCNYFNGFYLFLRHLYYSRSSHVSFVPIIRRLVPILEVLGTKLQNWNKTSKLRTTLKNGEQNI